MANAVRVLKRARPHLLRHGTSDFLTSSPGTSSAERLPLLLQLPVLTAWIQTPERVERFNQLWNRSGVYKII